MMQKWQLTTVDGELVEFKCRPTVVGNGAVLGTGPNKGKYLGVVALTDSPDDPNAEDGTICVIDGEVFDTKEQARAWAHERVRWWSTRHGAKPIGPIEPTKISMPLMVADQLARYQDELDELLDRMESRLNAIMHGGVPAQEGKQQAQISLALVPLAETIHGKVVAVQRANARIRDMLDRIEL